VRVLLLAGTHGDEIIGRNLLVDVLRLLKDIKQDHPVAQALSHTELWVVPCHNPDGCEQQWRTDAKGRDLNRYFSHETMGKDPLFGQPIKLNQLGENYPPENRAIVQLMEQYPFHLALTYHAGEIPTVNYPWDHSEQIGPVHELARALAVEYASFNRSMRFNPQFQSGVANGNRWYSIEGGFQDWALAHYDCMTLTPELTLLETPPLEQQQQHVDDNLPSTLSMIVAASGGAGVRMPEGISEGEIVIESRWQNEFRPYKKARFRHGYYYSVLLPGQYRIKIVPDKGKDIADLAMEVVSGQKTPVWQQALFKE
jgi:carboxypeptidase M/carboxypeptidase D